VRFNLKQPSAPLLSYLTDRAGMILSPKAVAELGENFGEAPVCNGPFKLVERGAQDRIVLERFDDYWDKSNIHFDKVILTPIPDGTVRVANLRAGQLDMIERVSPQDLTTLRSDSKIGITAAPELGYQMITFNTDNGPKSKTPLGQDARLREAFNAAIDRKVITKVVFNDEFIPGNQYISPKNFFFDPAFPVPPRDLARAKALMKEAGHPTYSFTLLTANDPDWIQAAQIIQSMVAEAGFDMKIEVLENATRSKRQQDGDFEAGFSFWSGRVDPDGNIGNRATCGGANNDAHYCNQDVMGWIDAARKSSNPEERKALYSKVTAQLAKDRPILFIWHRNVITAFNKKLQGFEQYSDGLIRLSGVKFDSKS
jgi:peptide/nickel transport system substrate-binding protein